MRKRRTKYDIYADLLDIVARRGYCRLTRASYGANLPVDRAKKSLRFLASRGFLSEEPVDESKIYRITKRGLEYLNTYRKMRKLFAALDETISPEQKEKMETYVHAKLSLREREARVGNNIDLAIDLINIGNQPAILTKIENIIPEGFELIAKPDHCHHTNAHLVMAQKVLDSKMTEKITLILRALEKGTFKIGPKITYENGAGQLLECRPTPTTIKILEGITSHVSTGIKAVDDLLLGGIPENYAVILTSVSCDEQDLLIRRFLETGIKNGKDTFYLTIEASNVKALIDKFKSNFYLFICNPQADTIVKDASNVFKFSGVENLTDINIALTSAFRKLDDSDKKERRACIEVVSDVLLQHHAVQTRRWLAGLLPELRSKGFTTLALLNPHMHASEEVQAILGLFDGEINIYEKEHEKKTRKYLRIKKMYNKRYLENEMPLIKERL